MHYNTNYPNLQVVDFTIYSGWNKNKSKTKRNLVKSDGMKIRLSQFCTFRQNGLPLARLREEGERGTQKQCNYSALAQQQRAKGGSKGFLWAKQGSLRGKAQPLCVNTSAWTFGPLMGPQEAKDECERSEGAYLLWLCCHAICTAAGVNK